ncbi:MAG: hypothetical protein LBS62_14840, partial [Clostridiales bacterium]|nr:hypothetical protein [Clostridiales bacterium]
MYAQKRLSAPARFLNALWRYKFLYVLTLPALAFTVLFAYVPLSGLIVAFQDYDIWKRFASPWAANFGFAHFIELFQSGPIIESIGKTVLLSSLNLLIG